MGAILLELWTRRMLRLIISIFPPIMSVSILFFPRQACSSHHPIVISICFWFTVCQTQPKHPQIVRQQCCQLPPPEYLQNLKKLLREGHRSSELYTKREPRFSFQPPSHGHHLLASTSKKSTSGRGEHSPCCIQYQRVKGWWREDKRRRQKRGSSAKTTIY